MEQKVNMKNSPQVTVETFTISSETVGSILEPNLEIG